MGPEGTLVFTVLRTLFLPTIKPIQSMPHSVLFLKDSF